MSVYEVDPLKDPRWEEFLQAHPGSSFFHTPAWLEALSRTYGYDLHAITTTKPGQPLTNGLVLCRVRSWLTGSRMVSLPFSDHCQPLVDRSEDLAELVGFLRKDVDSGRAKYCELRMAKEVNSDLSESVGLTESSVYCFHILDLRPGVNEIYRRFHKSCVQRKVQRAEREALTLQEGRSEAELAMFYRLLLLTRRRHQLPPQPLQWFRNLIQTCGDNLLIRVALKDGKPVASVLTLSHKKTVIYKYGCSDSQMHNLGGMPLLFWRAIREAKEQGAEEFDFGRSELDNDGLISFKDHWGGERSQLAYYRYPAASSEAVAAPGQMESALKAFSVLPDFCLTTAGRLLYRHIG
jgi:CelD/BcsL family acetyltransferase involved in cellulose biosynthesis